MSIDRPPMTADALKQALQRIQATYAAERKLATESFERAQRLYAHDMERVYSDALAASTAIHEAWMRGADAPSPVPPEGEEP